jgi:hypothetical protein
MQEVNVSMVNNRIKRSSVDWIAYPIFSLDFMKGKDLYHTSHLFLNLSKVQWNKLRKKEEVKK